MSRKYWYYHFKVTGGGTFPLDMLRYDACWPASTDDMNKMDQRSGIRTIELVSVGTNDWAPTDRRWESFLWRVEEFHKTTELE